MASFEIKWQAPEFEYRPKSISWYWTSIIIAVFLVGASVWQRNFLFGFFIVAAEILILAWAKREPALVNFVLSDKGLAIGEQKFYPLAELETWSLEDYEGNEWPNLFFQFKSRLRPAIKIKCAKDKFGEIGKALTPLLQQVEHEKSLFDTLEEFIGF